MLWIEKKGALFEKSAQKLFVFANL